ncbi:hypothetical protein RF11_11990 [Thelohanellus kitauei]|uniref:FLYWCH-type domain-containing protein n=1 Tax=Thelohanellus kitauei TaxID=669202 RepID=A0A0C2JAM9_THEKT|nr:hypothetical protein RF11_11990 [Thelohanellus kitauei]
MFLIIPLGGEHAPGFLISYLIFLGISKRGERTVIYRNFEYWNYRADLRGITTWRCCKLEQDVRLATLRTNGDCVVSQDLGHTHYGNGSQALAQRISEEISTPSSVQASVIVTLDDHVVAALPKRSTLNQSIRHISKDFILFDSGPGNDRIILMGDLELLDGLSRATVWLVDGTSNIVPKLYFQLYSIHFQYSGDVNNAVVYCLLPDKTQYVYDRMLIEIIRLVPTVIP